MRKILYLLIFAVIYSFLSAEFTFQFALQNGNAQDFQTNDIYSDYGMRRVPTGMSIWHKGVDFSRNESNIHLLAIDNGFVEEVYLNRESWKYKVLKINGNQLDYGFGHIFYDANCLTKYSTNL